MKRKIFSKPVPYTDLELNVETFIMINNGLVNDEDIANYINTFDDFNITERGVRSIVEALNYNLYIGIINRHQYRKINGRYHIIDKDSPYRERVLTKIKLDAMADLKRMHITLGKLSDVNIMQMSFADVIDYLESEEE